MEIAKDAVDRIIEQWKRQRPELNVWPIGIIGRISRLAGVLDKKLQQTFSKYGLNPGEFDVLASLRRSGEPFTLTPTMLFQFLMVTSGTMTNRLDNLEKAGYIQRSPDPNDRRGILVSLTPAGKEIVDRVIEVHLLNEERLLAVLDPAEREVIVGILRKLLISLE